MSAGNHIAISTEGIHITGNNGATLARLSLVFSVGVSVYRVVELVGNGPLITGRTNDPAVVVELERVGAELRVQLKGPFGESDAVVYFRDSKIEAMYGRTFVPDCDCRQFFTRGREEIFLTNSGMILQQKVNKKDLWMIAPPPHIAAFGEPASGWFGLSIPEAMPVVATRIGCDKGVFELSFQNYSPAHDQGRMPRVYLSAGLADSKAIIDIHRENARRLGLMSTSNQTPAWWHNPIYCTWGDQCYVQKTSPQTLKDSVSIPFSEEMMQRWADGIRSIYPGEVNYIVDAGWFDFLGDFEPSKSSFETVEDFKKALAKLKAKGFRVILWYTPFWAQPGSNLEKNHPELLLRRRDGKIYRDQDNRAMLDFSHPGAREHTRDRIEYMLKTLDADGFKIDMNYVHPLMTDITMHDASWSYGNRVCLEVTKFIYSCATAVKKDAFITISGIESYLQPYTSSVRLNDLFDFDHAKPWYDRAELVTRLMPGVAIDVDGWPASLSKMREYQFVSPVFGAPVTYYVEGVDVGPAKLTSVELNRMASVWHVYAQAPCENGMKVVVDADTDTFTRRGPDGKLRAIAIQKSVLACYSDDKIHIAANCDRAVAIPVESPSQWTKATKIMRDGRREAVALFHDKANLILNLEDAGSGILCYQIEK